MFELPYVRRCSVMPKLKLRSLFRCFINATILLLSFSFLAASRSQQGAGDEEKYSPSLVVVPSAQSPKYLRYPDGRQQLAYVSQAEYPAEEVLSFIRAELNKRGWKPLSRDFLNPDIPSSHERGWTFFEDQKQKPATAVWQWGADWENAHHDVTRYFLTYESPTSSTRNLRNLHVVALYIPAEIAAKMKAGFGPKK
jgi:hypothetical protein